MDEAFRRAIRKMTGKSVALLSSRPIHEELHSHLSTNIASAWTVILQEHISASLETDTAHSGGEYVARSDSAWELAQDLFPALHTEFARKTAEFRTKWHQRYTLEVLTPLLQQGEWLRSTPEGWVFNNKGTAAEVKDFYYETLHLMVGDAEKLLVMHFSRILHIQDRLVSAWHQESLNSPLSKVLPSFEAGMRDSEVKVFKNLRDNMSALTFKRFSDAFRGFKQPKCFPTPEAAARQIGRIWNPVGVWETGFLAFLQDFCDYLAGLIQLTGNWYYQKWTLYLRGFSAGQLDLFQR